MELYRDTTRDDGGRASRREAAKRFGVHRNMISKMLQFSIPPGHLRRERPASKKLGPYMVRIDKVLDDDKCVHEKQHYTTYRIFERLRFQKGFSVGCMIVGLGAGPHPTKQPICFVANNKKCSATRGNCVKHDLKALAHRFRGPWSKDRDPHYLGKGPRDPWQVTCHRSQLRAARVLAGLTQRTLGTALGVDERAVRFWERKHDRRPTSAPNDARIEQTLLDHGVILFAEPTPGARLAK